MKETEAPNSDVNADFKAGDVSSTLEESRIFSNSLAVSNDTTEPEQSKDHEASVNVPEDTLTDSETSPQWIEAGSKSEVSLAISREQTPDPDSDATSFYTDSAPDSPVSDADYISKSTIPSLATDRAVKKLKLDAGENKASEQVLEASSNSAQNDQNNGPQVTEKFATKATYSKRVSSKSIEKLWANLDKPALQSLIILFEMSMGKTIERFQGGSDNDPRVAECQRILTENWMSERLPKSFLARLNATKLPPLRSLVPRIKGIKSDDFDPLNIDQVNQRKGSLESILSAETKQLAGLEAYFKSLEDSFNSDSAYLKDFKKTVALQETSIFNEKQKLESQYNLHPPSRPPPDVRLHVPCSKMPDTGSSKYEKFDPNTDTEVADLLRDIGEKIDDTNLPMQELLGLCDDLDVIQRQMYSRQVDKGPGAVSMP